MRSVGSRTCNAKLWWIFRRAVQHKESLCKLGRALIVLNGGQRARLADTVWRQPEGVLPPVEISDSERVGAYTTPVSPNRLPGPRVATSLPFCETAADPCPTMYLLKDAGEVLYLFMKRDSTSLFKVEDMYQSSGAWPS